MGTTTNNGWPTPVATDLVQDGWEAIKDLGDAIDTTLGVYTPSTSGLTLINTTSFSAVASQSINDVFSSTYDNYKIILDITPSTGLDTRFRMRASGADDSTANYDQQVLRAADTVINGSRALNQTFGRFAQANTDNSGRVTCEFTLFAPNLAKFTYIHTIGMRTSGDITIENWHNIHSVATAFDGISILTSAGTITGTITVYGLAD